MESWKKIEEFPDYEVSSFGKVRNKNGLELKQLNVNGYLVVNLYKGRRMKQLKVHRLVATAFYGESNLQVNHKDGNKTNNCVDNLEWCTSSENAIHAHRVLKIPHGGGSSKRAVANKTTGEVFESIAEAALSVGTSYQNIRQSILRDGGTCKKCKWEFI